MSSAGKIEQLWISYINPHKRINIILKDTYGNIIYAETMDYNEKKHKSCSDIANYISNKFDYRPGLCCNYDETTKINYIYNDAKANGDFINWKIDFNNVDIKDAFKGQPDNSITVTIVNVPYGLGNSGSFAPSEVITLIKVVIWIVKYCIYVMNPYKKLREHYHKEKEFINRTILLGDTWKYGFISNENFEFKKTVEKSIMKKLGYKNKNNCWKKINKKKL